MKRILSDEYCTHLVKNLKSYQWERVFDYSEYSQLIIQNYALQLELENFFGRPFSSDPILKVIKLQKGEKLRLYSADYSKASNEAFSNYKNTNFIIKCYLNNNFTGGILSKPSTYFMPRIGYGLIQNKTEKYKVTPVESGEAYMLYCFIPGIESDKVL